jgi:PAS domain S-box-containing protein
MIQADSLDQVKGQCMCPMVTSEYRQEFLDLTRRVFQGGSGTLLFEMVGLKGRRLWLETHAVPLRDDKQETIALLGVTRDVTEQTRTEEALQRSEARFRAIIETAPVGIMVAAADGSRILYANPASSRLLGYSERELLSLTPMQLAVEDELSDSAAAFKAHAEGRAHATERDFRRKDRSTIRLGVNTVGIELDGQACLAGFFSDVTQRLLLEEERLKAQKLESIGTLAGGIAHDFNNLLQGISRAFFRGS